MNITQYWASFFNVAEDRFEKSGIELVPHASLGDYWGIWIFSRNDSVVISSPDSFLPNCEALLATNKTEDLKDIVTISKLFEPHAEQVIGPAYHGSLSSEDFLPFEDPDSREISFEEAQEANDGEDPTGWDWSGCGDQKEHYFGVFRNGKLGAVSNYSIKEDLVAFPGVYTNAEFRGEGLSKFALSSAFKHSLDAGLIMDYQTLCSNVGAIKAAERLGVKEFSRHIAIRLKAEG